MKICSRLRRIRHTSKIWSPKQKRHSNSQISRHVFGRKIRLTSDCFPKIWFTIIVNFWPLLSTHYWPLFKTLLNTIDRYSKHYRPLLSTIQNTIDHYWALLKTRLKALLSTRHYWNHYWNHYWALFYPKCSMIASLIFHLVKVTTLHYGAASWSLLNGYYVLFVTSEMRPRLSPLDGSKVTLT